MEDVASLVAIVFKEWLVVHGHERKAEPHADRSTIPTDWTSHPVHGNATQTVLVAHGRSCLRDSVRESSLRVCGVKLVRGCVHLEPRCRRPTAPCRLQLRQLRTIIWTRRHTREVNKPLVPIAGDKGKRVKNLTETDLAVSRTWRDRPGGKMESGSDGAPGETSKAAGVGHEQQK